MASQVVIYGRFVLLAAAAWLAVIFEWIPLLEYGPNCSCFRNAVLFAPVLAVLGLGVYALFSVVYGVATFNDCAAAREELVKEIKEARADLKRRNVID